MRSSDSRTGTELLGYRPQTPFARGIDRMAAWMLRNQAEATTSGAG